MSVPVTEQLLDRAVKLTEHVIEIRFREKVDDAVWTVI